MATLEGVGMRDDNSLSFARMIRRHIEKSTGREPLSFSELINNLKSRQPLQPLFNTIAWTLKAKAGMTSFGYVKVESKFLADRIWSIISDWESLIKKENSQKVIALSTTVNRVTGSKEVANLLHKCVHGISYADIRHLNKSWANEVTNKQILPGTFSSGRSIHVPLIIQIGSNKRSLKAKLHTTQMVSHFNYKPAILQK